MGRETYAGFAGIVHGVLAVIPTGVEIGAGVKQRHNRRGVAAQRGEMKRRAAEGVGLVDLGEQLGDAQAFVQIEVD